MPSVMIEKVAESRALRRAFPSDFSGIYSEDEMAQSKSHKSNDDNNEIAHQLEVQKVQKEIITDSQAAELDAVIGSDVKYRHSVLKFLKTECNLDSFSGMPKDIFNRAYAVAKKRASEKSADEMIAVGV